ncbi:MAG: hypothetical protein ACC657_01945 [Thiohalomonadales bacterium]
MFRIVSRSCIYFFVIVISGCSTLSIPDWVEGESQYYIPKDYLLGHGVGGNISVAEDNASRKITQQFNLLTTSEELSSQTNIIFNQIEFEEPWLNTDTDQYHVLAFISRDKAASFILNKMLALDELTYQFFEQAKNTTDLLEQTSYIDSALNAQTRRIKLKPVLKIVNSENDIPSSYNINRLTKIRDQLQVRINLQVDIKQEKPNVLEIDSIIKNSLDSAGFIRNKNISSKNHLLVELKINESPMLQTSGEFFMQGVLTASLKHQGEKSVRGQYQWTFNLTAKDHESLIQKTRQFLTTQLNTNLKRVIMDMMIIEYAHEENVPDQDYVDFDMPEFNKPKDITNSKTSSTKSNNLKPESSVVLPLSTEKMSGKNNQIKNNEEKTTESTQSNKQDSAPVSNTLSNTPAAANNTQKSSNTNPAPSNNKIPENNSSVTDDDPISTLPPLSN